MLEAQRTIVHTTLTLRHIAIHFPRAVLLFPEFEVGVLDVPAPFLGVGIDGAREGGGGADGDAGCEGGVEGGQEVCAGLIVSGDVDYVGHFSSEYDGGEVLAWWISVGSICGVVCGAVMGMVVSMLSGSGVLSSGRNQETGRGKCATSVDLQQVISISSHEFVM